MNDSMSFEDFKEKLKQGNGKFNLNYKGKKGGGAYKGSLSFLIYKTWWPVTTPTWIKLINTTEDDLFYKFHAALVTSETNKKKYNVISNSKNGELEVPDNLLYYATNGFDSSKPTDKKYVAQRKDAVTVVVLDDFHKIENTSKNDTTYYTYERCLGKDRKNKSICTNCDNKIETVFGQKFYWSLGYAHVTQLRKQLDDIHHECSSCKKGNLIIEEFVCSNCNISISTTDALDEAGVKFLSTELIDCDACSKEMLCKPLYKCWHYDEDSGKDVPGCDNPQLTDINDIDIQVVKEGSAPATIVKINRWRKSKPLEDETLSMPMPFSRFLQYMSLEEQATKIGKPNMFDASADEFLEDFFKEVEVDSSEADSNSEPK